MGDSKNAEFPCPVCGGEGEPKAVQTDKIIGLSTQPYHPKDFIRTPELLLVYCVCKNCGVMFSPKVEIIEENLPKAIYEGEIKLGDITLRVAVLDDGRRVIEQESFMAFLRALETGTVIISEEVATEIAKFIRGMG